MYKNNPFSVGSWELNETGEKAAVLQMPTLSMSEGCQRFLIEISNVWTSYWYFLISQYCF